MRRRFACRALTNKRALSCSSRNLKRTQVNLLCRSGTSVKPITHSFSIGKQYVCNRPVSSQSLLLSLKQTTAIASPLNTTPIRAKVGQPPTRHYLCSKTVFHRSWRVFNLSTLSSQPNSPRLSLSTRLPIALHLRRLYLTAPTGTQGHRSLNTSPSHPFPRNNCYQVSGTEALCLTRCNLVACSAPQVLIQNTLGFPNLSLDSRRISSTLQNPKLFLG
jgi:hypothetical protein